MWGTELRTPRRMHEHLAITDLGARSLSRLFVSPTANKCKNTSGSNWTYDILPEPV